MLHLPMPDDRGYPVRLARTGCVIGYCRNAIPAREGEDGRPIVPDIALHRFDEPRLWMGDRPDPAMPLAVVKERLWWDAERGCLVAETMWCLRCAGFDPA